ncbi:MAG: matrixin family metalloprotease, partial [Candidatus Binataceae bacterium]
MKILVDDDERAARRAWEGRLRDRLRAASQLFEAQFGLGFEVVAVDAWRTENAIDDFEAALSEFEHAVPAEPAKLAIGFTSQYQLPHGRTHLGGTRLPLASHILVREWSQHFSERERFEMLVHELAHYLGAAHSPEPDSVMRPLLGDRQALSKRFQVGFDPLNTLAIALVAEQVQRGDVRRLSDLPPQKIERLCAIYATLEQTMPDDPAAPQLLGLIGGASRVTEIRQETRVADGASSRDRSTGGVANPDSAFSRPSKMK